MEISQFQVIVVSDNVAYTTIYDENEITSEIVTDALNGAIFTRTEKSLFNDRQQIELKFYTIPTKDEPTRSYISLVLLE